MLSRAGKPRPRTSDARGRGSYKMLEVPRIVRAPVLRVAHAVVIPVAVYAIRNPVMVAVSANGLPAALNEKPPAVALFPVRRLEMLAAALAHPRAFHPDVLMVLPLPVPGDEDITPARCRDDFVTRRGRPVAIAEVLRERRGRN